MTNFIFEPQVVPVPVRTWTYDSSVLENGEVPYALAYAFEDFGYKASTTARLVPENDYERTYDLVLKPITSNPDEEVELVRLRDGETVAVLGYRQLHLLTYLTGETRHPL